MKKHLLIFAALVATMTGCVKNEVMDVPDSGEISFDTYVGKHTRAVVINGRSDLSRFYVYGNMTNADGTGLEEVFNCEDVVWTGTSAQNGLILDGTIPRACLPELTPGIWLSIISGEHPNELTGTK